MIAPEAVARLARSLELWLVEDPLASQLRLELDPELSFLDAVLVGGETDARGWVVEPRHPQAAPRSEVDARTVRKDAAVGQAPERPGTQPELCRS